MPQNDKNNSQTQFGQDLANFVSKFVSPPTMAIVAAVSFSLWSPIGLGSLCPALAILLSFLLFVFFPFLPVIYFYRKKVIDLYISKRESRTPFYIMAIACYFIAAIVFFATNTKIMFLLALAYTSVSIVLLIVNLFWKVSIHCAGVTGPIFALFFVFGIIALPLSLIIMVVGWSRIKLKNHTFAQTIVGTVIALTIGLLEYNIFYQVVL
jgi:hypothetical protein